jgi:hypothetical protein
MEEEERGQSGILIRKDLLRKGKIRALELGTTLGRVVEAGIELILKMPDDEARELTRIIRKPRPKREPEAKTIIRKPRPKRKPRTSGSEEEK